MDAIGKIGTIDIPMDSRQGTPAVEVGPDRLTADEALVHLPEVVACCLRWNSPILSICVFARGASAVYEVVRREWSRGKNPYELGGVYNTAVHAARTELAKIRKMYFWNFTPTCLRLDAILIWLGREAHRQRWRTRPSIDLDEVHAEQGKLSCE